MTSQYLPLTEYSTKYKVSISTLRRRIKADEIKYVFEEGKYMILDNGAALKGGPELDSESRNVHRPSQKSEKTEAALVKPRKTSPAPSPKEPSADSASPFQKGSNAFAKVGSFGQSAEVTTEWNEEFKQFDARDRQEPILTAANRLLTELKKAYAQVLQEKEEQILLLREEVSDLKTLVRALDSEHAKSKNRSRS